ncbi:MAG: hypothetical protein E7010_03305 [Alphaproteobacteria bacterium]|nr:hypothetical protein [Alphaproteobacteria bacterium]
MTNVSKLSKVMLLAGALVFASFYSTDANAGLLGNQGSSLFPSNISTSVADDALEKARINTGDLDAAARRPDLIDGNITTAGKAAVAANNMSDLQAEQYKNQKAYSKAQSEYNEKVGAQQKEVQKKKAECQANPNKCEEYIEAQKGLERIKREEQAKVDAARKTVEETSDKIKKQQKETTNAVYEAQKEANKELKSANKALNNATDKLNNAEKDIAKYCEGGSKPNKEKCIAAERARDEAQNAITTASRDAKAANAKLDAANKAEARATGQDALTQKAIAERDAQVKSNKQEIDKLRGQIENCANKTGTEKQKCQRENQEKQDKIKELENYNKGVEQAKRKEGLPQTERPDPESLASEMVGKQNEYNKKKNAYAEKVKELNKAQAACAQDSQSEACGKIETLKQEVTSAKNAADKAYKDKVDAENSASGIVGEKDKVAAQKAAAKEAKEKACTKGKENSAECKAAEKALQEAEKEEKLANVADAQKAVDAANQDVENKTEELNDLRAQLAEAQAACEYSSKLTSKAGKADAEKYCAQAAELEGKVKDAEDALDQAAVDAEAANEALNMANAALAPEDQDHTGQVYQAVSTAKHDLFSGKYIGGGEFGNTEDIFKTMTRRAMRILVGLKPIVYTFAGFGLIGFAWMAIFNKISWKWFSNIAISLFLVANMGRFIEYFVYPDINGEVQAQKLAFGDYLSKGYADTDYVWVDEQSAYMPPELLGEEEIPDVGINVPEAEKHARGFCQAEKKGGGLFGGGGFMSCVKDIVAAGKKAVDTVKKVQDTVNTVKSGVQTVVVAAKNIGAAAEMIGKGNLEDTFKALGQIGQNVNAMIGASGGMVNGIMSNVSAITNNVQDMTKSRDQVAELNEKRAKGEATSRFDAFFKGQKMDADGNVERLWGGTDKDGNQKQGAIADNSNWWTKTQNGTNNIVEKSRQLNGQYQDAMQMGGDLAQAIGNFTIPHHFNGKTGQWEGSTETINQKLQEKQAEKRAEENKKYQQEQEAQRDAKKEASQNLAAGQELANNQASSTPNQNNYDAAVRDADKAEIVAKNKEAVAANATADYEAKQEVYEDLDRAATDAEARAKASGSPEDQKAAERARARANIAQAEANAAKNKADAANAAADQARQDATDARDKANNLRGDAVDEGIDKAQNAQTTANDVIEKSNNIIEEEKGKVASQEQAVADADKALQEAIAKAQASGSEEDYREVGRLQNEKKQAEAALKQTQQNISKAEADKAAAERAKAQAEIEETRLRAEQEAGLTQDDVEQMERDDKQAEYLRQQYLNNSTETAQAKAAESKAAEARVAAENAKMEAERKAQAAERAKAEAEAAAKKAQESGSLEDQKAAELAQKRADLAEAEAEAAQEKIDPLEQEAKEKAIASIEASIKEAQYLQTYYQKEMDDADTEIGRLRGSLSIEESNVNIARQGYNEALERAKELNTTEAILAAKAAADKLAEAQEALSKLQKDLEKQILRRNNAEKSKYDAEEREAELEKQKRELEN